jgi:Transposase DDE domain
VISTVDPQARHGHKTAARGFDGYKGHIGIDPDSEIITVTLVGPGNAGDAAAAEELIGDLLDEHTAGAEIDTLAEVHTTGTAQVGGVVAAVAAVAGVAVVVAATVAAVTAAVDTADAGEAADRTCVYGDNAYGTGEFQDRLDRAGIESKCKTQPPVAAGGRFAKDRFDIDPDADTVRCPAGNTTPIVRDRNGAGTAAFGAVCVGCPLREQCTTARAGRTISIGVHEGPLAAARARQRDPDWLADYRATRPKVERKFGHLMRRKHGGRRARVRGTTKIAADFALLAAAVNLARLAVLGVTSTRSGWAATG